MSDGLNNDPEGRQIRVGLALSGGGSRAIAFHLGSMKALRDLGVLPMITTISAVSGGSVLAGLWACSNGEWDSFESQCRNLLTEGLAKRMVKATFLSWRGLFFPTFFLAWLFASTLLLTLKCILWPIFFLKVWSIGKWSRTVRDCLPSQVPRIFSRSLALQMVLDSIYKGRNLDELSGCDFELILNATELRTGTAFRFGNKVCACRRTSRAGEARFEGSPSQFKLSTAVTASAAYPLFLPTLDIKFQPFHGDSFWVSLTDGGVYDNLGISCLAPGRTREFSAHTPKPDYVLCSSAAQGRKEAESLTSGWVLRLVAVTLLQFRKLQESGFQQLFAWKKSGHIKGFGLSYLGQRYSGFGEAELSRALSYPTDFNAMKPKDQELLIEMGYMLMTQAIEKHCPHLGRES